MHIHGNLYFETSFKYLRRKYEINIIKIKIIKSKSDPSLYFTKFSEIFEFYALTYQLGTFGRNFWH